MEPLEPYLETITTDEGKDRHIERKVTRCPACTRLDTLHLAKDMVLCTYCFWAMEMKQAS